MIDCLIVSRAKRTGPGAVHGKTCLLTINRWLEKSKPLSASPTTPTVKQTQIES
jgi:hypothetical protein